MGIIERTDFNGVSGRIKFYGGPSRFSVVHVMQWQKNESKLIGSFHPNITEDTAQVIFLYHLI